MLSILKEIGTGAYYVKTGLILRDAVLKCKLLLNCEVWHNVTQKQVQMLEKYDKLYMRRILNCHDKVATECLYLEHGKLPLQYEIMIRRFMYLWKILHLDKSELVYRVFQSQVNSPNSGDWVKLIQKDKLKINLEISDTEIEEMSKGRFKNLIKRKVQILAISDLNEAKIKHSKSQYLNSKNFKTAQYLEDQRFSKKESQLLFSLRSHTLNLKMNFKNQHTNTYCEVCQLFPETQSHILHCPQITSKLNIVNLPNSVPEENYIYGRIDKQLEIVKIFSQILEVRKSILEDRLKSTL